MCFFFGDFNVTTPQRCSSPHTHTHTHEHTNTHTGQPWLVGQVVPEEFFRVLQNFWTTSGQQEFFGPPGGHATYENIILRVLIVSFVYVCIFVQALCCKVYG